MHASFIAEPTTEWWVPCPFNQHAMPCAGKHARRCCGCSCAWLPSCCSCVPPAWWYGYSKRQRLLIQTACLCGVGLLVAVAVGLPLWFTLAVCHGSFMC